MEKIYGYKEKDILGLAEFVLSKENRTLTDTFSEYAKKSGKAQGTIRNLYYALAKKSSQDQDFCQKYLGGKTLGVSKIVEFSREEEERLVKDILSRKLKGKSVRKAISELALGDEKKALRYQNKFRNFIKNCPEKVEEYTRELMPCSSVIYDKNQKESFNSVQIKKLKSEINGLIDKLTLSLKKENEKLKIKLAFLESENEKLKRELGLNVQTDNAVRFFLKRDGSQVLN